MSGPGLLYVYTVVESGAEPLCVDGIGGVGGGPGLRVIGDGVVAAVAEPVDPADFDEGALRGRLEDLDWLSTLARAHHRVVAAVGRSRTTVPLRLATVCRGEEGVLRLLAEGRDRLCRALARVEGAEEWGVKLYAAAPDGAAAGRPGPDPGPGSGAAAGREYLQRRLGDRRRREARAGLAARTAEQLHGRLAAQAAGAVLHPPQQARLSGAVGTNVLNAAYLVPREGRQAFLAGVPGPDALPPGLHVDVTGPWVPYSFTQDPGAEQGGRR
ncbi:GvpL/GvpF family gas vesicle protein [Streptomyces sp. NPDC057011]|uniref:GvpL/GvpF family gas vesicle protein n=1 Tax=unclassified Streptomyces TaxID=2593676 RepID=UPI003644AE31